MRLVIISLLMLATLNNCALAQSASDTLYRSVIDNDGSVNTIYVERDNDSEWYLPISDFNFGRFDTASYKSSLRYLADSNMPLVKREIKGLPLKWLNLERYRDSFYLYKPCDFLYTNQVAITDSAYIDYTGEGPWANSILDYKQVSKQVFRFRLFDYRGDYNLTIHIIDEERGIAVFEEKRGSDSFYYAMIDATKMKNLPIIVNHCIGDKADEFTFPEFDYSTLIPEK